MSLSLERMQAAFAAALLDPAAVAGLRSVLTDGDARLAERMAIYRGSLAGTWRQALGAAYPVVRALVGEEFFLELARAYGQAHPSSSGDLNGFGEQFAPFVAAFRHTESLPYLAEVARLEWLVHSVHHAGDAMVLRRERIAALLPDELLAARFVLNPACAWLASEAPVVTLWLAHQPAASTEFPQTLARREHALVVRPRWRVEVLRADAGELAALDALRAGANMDETIAVALRADGDFDFAAAFVRWLDHNVLVDLDEHGSLLDPAPPAAPR